MNYAFYICDTLGFLRVMYFVRTILTILSFVIPFGLIIFTALDIYKGVINPDNKDIAKKIGTRILVAVLVFLVPTIITGVLNLFDFVSSDSNYQTSRCYTNANSDCLDKITSYLNCDDFSDSEKKECQRYRSCNNYTLTNSCDVKTELDSENCSNLDQNGYKYFK